MKRRNDIEIPRVTKVSRPIDLIVSRTFKIDKGIPIPETRGGRSSGEPKFPFLKMKIGDSFHIERIHKLPYQTVQKRVHVHLAAMKKSKKISRTFGLITAEEKGGLRVWRAK